MERQTRDAGVPHVELAPSLTSSLPPLSESSLNVPALPPPYLDVSLQDMDTLEQVEYDTASICGMFHTSSHKYFLSDYWTIKHRDSS